MPHANADRLWIAMSAKTPADCFQVFINRSHRNAKILGNLPRGSTYGEPPENVHPSICEHQSWIESRPHCDQSSPRHQEMPKPICVRRPSGSRGTDFTAMSCYRYYIYLLTQ